MFVIRSIADNRGTFACNVVANSIHFLAFPFGPGSALGGVYVWGMAGGGGAMTAHVDQCPAPGREICPTVRQE